MDVHSVDLPKSLFKDFEIGANYLYPTKKDSIMIITIDTKKDNKNDIKKAIKLLQSLVESDTNSGFHEDFPSGENVLGLFDNAPSSDEPEKKEESDFSLDQLQTY